MVPQPVTTPSPGTLLCRSEERRVGKECRCRWMPAQAEDGIRVLYVTGVQTCALPIYDQDPGHGAVLQRHVLDLDHLVGVRFRERAAEHGEILGEHIGDAAIDGAPAGDHAVAWDFALQIGRASCREGV